MQEIKLPPQALRFMAEDDEKFMNVGLHHVKNALLYVDPETILDLGCGYGRMAYALRHIGWSGRYLGMDILKNHIRWLQENFTSVDERFQFLHFDIMNGRYNPEGKLSVSDLSFPPYFAPNLVLMLSVFTHMYENEIEIYLQKLSVVGARNAIIFVSFFTLREDGPARPYDFKHILNDHCAYHDLADPLHAIAYDKTWLMELFERTGWHCKEMLPAFQDIFVLCKK